MILKADNFLLLHNTFNMDYSIFANPVYLKSSIIVKTYPDGESYLLEEGSGYLDYQGIGDVELEDGLAFITLDGPRAEFEDIDFREIASLLRVEGYVISCSEVEDEMVSPTGFEPVTN